MCKKILELLFGMKKSPQQVEKPKGEENMNDSVVILEKEVDVLKDRMTNLESDMYSLVECKIGEELNPVKDEYTKMVSTLETLYAELVKIAEHIGERQCTCGCHCEEEKGDKYQEAYDNARVPHYLGMIRTPGDLEEIPWTYYEKIWVGDFVRVVRDMTIECHVSDEGENERSWSCDLHEGDILVASGEYDGAICTNIEGSYYQFWSVFRPVKAGE